MSRAALAKPTDALAAWMAVRDEARQCRACDLWRPATQTVFGEGPVHAPLMFVGEQPGDKEDLAGKPFGGFRRGPAARQTVRPPAARSLA